MTLWHHSAHLLDAVRGTEKKVLWSPEECTISILHMLWEGVVSWTHRERGDFNCVNVGGGDPP